MEDNEHQVRLRTAKAAGWSLIASIVLGIGASVFLTRGIDINLSADLEATARNMLDAELRVRAKAYLSVAMFALESFFVICLYRLLIATGPLFGSLSAVLGVAGAIVVLSGAVANLNVAELVSAPAYSSLTGEQQRLMLAALEVSTDYTSFHLGLILTTLAKAGFFFLLLKSRLIPPVISGWGVFASLFVVTAVVGRDFLPVLANSAVTAAFMLSNLVALVATGLYMAMKGVRSS